MNYKVIPMTTSGLNSPSAANILLLENDTIKCHLYAKALHYVGCHVYTATTVRQAGRCLDSQERFEFFLCDMKGGHETGYSLLRRYHTRLAADRTVVIAMGDAACEPVLKEWGIEFCLRKPVTVHALVRLVQRLSSVADGQRALAYNVG